MADSEDPLRVIGEWVMATYANRDRIPAHPRVVHSQEIAQTLAASYYHRLNCDTAFGRDLRALFEDWTVSGASAFVTAWRLPAAAIRDLEWSRVLWQSCGRRGAFLSVGMRCFPGHEDDATEEERRRLGYKPWPTRLRNAKDLARGAERLYSRMIDGEHPEAIAAREKAVDRRPADSKAVRTGTTLWAEAVGVQLPKRSRGRPRRVSLSEPSAS